MKREEAERRGRRGERLAAWYLRFKGWRVLAHRVKTHRGEIDLIARRGKLVAFIEVKWRNRAADLDFAIDEWRLRRVTAAVESTAHRWLKPGDDMRIDVVLLAPGRWPRHITNATQL